MKGLIISVIAAASILLSCSPLVLEPMEPSIMQEESGPLLTKSGDSPVQLDMSAVTHFFQTNHKVILIHHVEFRDSVYVQTLTPEDMVALKITEEEQEFGNQYVISLNELIKQQ